MPGKRTSTITLGGVDYTVHAFNIDELEQLAMILSNDSIQSAQRSFMILKLALLRADPKISDVGEIEPDSLDEVVAAAKVIMDLAGLKAAANPQTAAETTFAA